MNTASNKRSGVARYLLVGAACVAVLSLLLLYFAPEEWMGVEADKVGFALIWPALIVALIGLRLLPARIAAASPITFGEKSAWVSLLVVVLAGAYLVAKLHATGWAVDVRGRDHGRVVSHVGTLWIVASILLQELRRREAGAAVEDERDATIRQRASNAGYTTLAVLLAVFAVTIGYSLVEWYPLTSPLVVSYTAIGMLMVSEAIRHGVEIVLYRRDRT